MFKKRTLLFFLSITAILQSQTVSTVTEGSFTDGLAIDSQGNIYGSDWSGNTVYKYDTNGNVSIFKDGFSNPNGIGVNDQDDIYICDHTDDKIYKYTANGSLTESWTGNDLTTPSGIQHIPDTNHMLFVEYGTFNPDGSFISSSKIKLLDDETGTITTLYEGAPLFGPAGITFIDDVAYIANFIDRKIFKFEDDNLIEITQLSATAPSSNFLGFLSSFNGKLIATQIGENKIYTIDPNDGTIALYAGSMMGSNDGDLNTATFSSPNGILGDDSTNRIYISDGTPKNLRIINDVTLFNEIFITNQSDVQLFPNPSKDSLNIKIGDVKKRDVAITIIDFSGKEVFSQQYISKNSMFTTTINTNRFASGMYTVIVKHNEQEISKKVIF